MRERLVITEVHKFATLQNVETQTFAGKATENFFCHLKFFLFMEGVKNRFARRGPIYWALAQYLKDPGFYSSRRH